MAPAAKNEQCDGVAVKAFLRHGCDEAESRETEFTDLDDAIQIAPATCRGDGLSTSRAKMPAECRTSCCVRSPKENCEMK